MTVAIVDMERCMGCGLCVDLCPYKGATIIKEWKSRINETICRGCGVCTGICPSSALNMKYLTNRQILARVRVLLKTTRAGEVFEPKILILICDWLSRKGANLSDVSRVQHSSNVRATKFPCIGAIDPMFIFDALLSGADGVLVAGCGVKDCDHIDGNINTESRIKHAKMCLKDLGIGSERLKFELIPLSAARAKFIEAVREIIETVKSLGPNILQR